MYSAVSRRKGVAKEEKSLQTVCLCVVGIRQAMAFARIWWCCLRSF